MNWTEVITAGLAAIAAVAGSAVVQSKTVAVLQTKLDALKEDVQMLSERVNKHNGVVERMAVVESKIKAIEQEVRK